jgi:hypothetical protein
MSIKEYISAATFALRIKNWLHQIVPLWDHYEIKDALISQTKLLEKSQPNKERSLRKLNNLSRVFASKPNGLGLNLNLLCSVSFFIFYFVSFFCLFHTLQQANSKDCSYKFFLYFVRSFAFCFAMDTQKEEKWNTRANKKEEEYTKNYGFASNSLPELCSWLVTPACPTWAMEIICHFFNN